MEVCNRARYTSPSYGGYDNHFTAIDLEKYTCTICTKVFRDPRLTPCCGQHFCESCLMHWLREHSTCPNCREEDFDHIVDEKFIREINSLTVRCSNKKDGCECELELGSLKEHLVSAGGCGYVLVACPNNCGGERIKRKDINTHRTECPLELVDCPFRDTAGCKIKLVRSDVAGHVESSVQDHLLLTTMAFTRIKKKTNAASIHVNKMLEDCEQSQRVPLESIRSILDDSYYLIDEGDQLQLFTAVMTLKHLPSGDIKYIIGAPCFFFQDGYKMKVEFTIIQNTPPTNSKVIVSLYMLRGEFDDILEWPLNSHNLDLNLTLSIDTDGGSSSSFDSPSDTEVECSASGPSARSDSESFTLQTQIPFCPDSSSGCLLRTKYLECLIDEEYRIFKEVTDVSHAVAQKLTERPFVFTLTVCQHEHIKRLGKQ